MPDEIEKKKDIAEQKSSTEITGDKKKVERQQDKYPGKDREIVEHESPEVNSDIDPRF